MLLQEIFKPEYANETEIYGLEINEESADTKYSSPPEHFESLGFLWKQDEDNMIDDELLNIIIFYKLTNVTVFVEVPSQLLVNKVIEPKYLIQLSTNVDFYISLLPPGHPQVGNSITQEQYLQLMEDFTREMVKKHNYEKFVAPISNFMEYLMLECLLGTDSPAIKNYKPTHFYIVENFANLLSTETSDAFKAKIREVLYEYYGGREKFELISKLTFEGIYKKSKEIYTTHIQDHLRNNPPQMGVVETVLDTNALDAALADEIPKSE